MPSINLVRAAIPTPTGPESSTPDLVINRTTRTLLTIFRNSLLSAAIAWIFAFCCTVGNVFSGRPPGQQSDEEFLVAKMLWFHIFFCAVTIAIFTTLLLTEQLAEFIQARSPLRYWIGRFVRLTSLYCVAVALCVVGGCMLLFRCLEDSSKACVYFTHSCFYVFVGCTDVQSRYLFRTETTRGQVRTRQQLLRLQRRQSENPSNRPSSPHRRRFLRVLLSDLPLMASAVFTTAYVHIVSSVKIATQWDLALFAVSSISLKLLLQELAKSFLVKKRRTPNMRMMAITVAAPTILIDTQLRTVLLCQDNASMTVVGSFVLALAEIVCRVAKTTHVRWHVRRVSTQQPTPFTISAGAASKTKVSHIHVAPLRTTSSLRIIDPIQDRVHRLLSLHAAEVYADMYAEYIAMGCSYGILLFFGAHPKYRLSNSSSRATNLRITGLQLGLEVATDFVACALETRWGIDFERLNQDDAFLAVFMVAVALVNVHISSGISLRSSTSRASSR